MSGIYKDLIYKNASVFVNSVDDLIKQVGKVMPEENAANAVRKAMDKGGTGSLFADLALGLPKKIKVEGKPVVKDNIENFIWGYKKKLENADMFLGNALGKKNKIFDDFVDVSNASAKEGAPDEVLRYGVKRLTTPVSKVKDFILPTVGAFTISSQLYKDPNQQKGGGELNEG